MRVLSVLVEANERRWYQAFFKNSDLRQIKNLINARLKVPNSTLLYHVPIFALHTYPSEVQVAQRFNVTGLRLGEEIKYPKTPTLAHLNGVMVGSDEPSDLRFYIADPEGLRAIRSNKINISELEAAWQTSPNRRSR